MYNNLTAEARGEEPGASPVAYVCRSCGPHSRVPTLRDSHPGWRKGRRHTVGFGLEIDRPSFCTFRCAIGYRTVLAFFVSTQSWARLCPFGLWSLGASIASASSTMWKTPDLRVRPTGSASGGPEQPRYGQLAAWPVVPSLTPPKLRGREPPCPLRRRLKKPKSVTLDRKTL